MDQEAEVKTPIYRRILCKLGLHQFEEITPSGGLCVLRLFIGMDQHNGCVDRCKGCQKVVDGRCKDCRTKGQGYCIAEFRRQERARRLRKNCCSHCPKEPHLH